MKLKIVPCVLLCFIFSLSYLPSSAFAASALEIKANANVALEELKGKVLDVDTVLKDAKGILVFPGVWKAGFGLGGEYGEGALLVNGQVADYYSIAGASLGFQLGIQKKKLVILFMNDNILSDFRHSDGWEFGVNAAAALVTVGLDGRINSYTTNEPILVFVVSQKGLMYNLTLEGYKLTRIKKD